MIGVFKLNIGYTKKEQLIECLREVLERFEEKVESGNIRIRGFRFDEGECVAGFDAQKEEKENEEPQQD